MRNSDQAFSWTDLDAVLLAGIRLSAEIGLDDTQRVLQRTLFRGRKLLNTSYDPDGVLVVFTRKLPNAQGVSAETLLADLQDMKLVRKMNGRHGQAPAHQATAKHSYGRAGGGTPFPSPYAAAAPAYTAAAPAGPVSVAASTLASSLPAPVMLPLPKKKGPSGKKRGGGRRGPGAGSPSSPPLQRSARELAALADFNAQIQAAQEKLPEIPGGPQCNNCAGKARNRFHHHLTCAYSTCTRCGRGGHRAAACPY